MTDNLNEKLKNHLPAVATGVMLVLSFPPFGLSMLAWVALVPLMFSIYGATQKEAITRSLIAGFIYFTGVMPWIYIVLTEYGHIWFGIAIILTVLLMLYLSLYMGLFGFLVSKAAISPGRLFLAPVVMVVLEYIRSHFLTGLPWALLAHSQSFVPENIQVAEFTGASGVTFLITLVNTGIAYLLIEAKEKKIPLRGIVTALLIILLAWKNHQWGAERMTLIDSLPHKTVNAALIQGNVDQGVKWNPAFKEEVTAKYERLTKEAADKGAELFVWPETAIQFYFGHSVMDSVKLLNFSKELGGPLIFGGLGTIPQDDPDKKYRVTNRAYGLTDGKVAGHYDKMHLVPFGEYVPMRKLLFFVNTITDTLSGDIVAGTSTKPMELNGIPVGVQICFEIMFPGQTRDFNLNGAKLMVNITNDAWFGRTGASAQHLAALPFRAVENRIPVIRSANTGISAFVSSSGRITQPTNLYEEAMVVEEIKVPELPASFYGSYGEAMPWYFMAALFVGFPLLAGGKRDNADTDNRG